MARLLFDRTSDESFHREYSTYHRDREQALWWQLSAVQPQIVYKRLYTIYDATQVVTAWRAAYRASLLNTPAEVLLLTWP